MQIREWLVVDAAPLRPSTSGTTRWPMSGRRQPYSYLLKSYYAYPNPSLSRPGTDLTPRQVPNVERRDAWNLPMTTRVPHGPRHPAAPAAPPVK